MSTVLRKHVQQEMNDRGMFKLFILEYTSFWHHKAVHVYLDIIDDKFTGIARDIQDICEVFKTLLD